MKKFKKVLLIVVAIIAILSISGYVYMLTTKPQYDGEVALQTIDKETTVYFLFFCIAVKP